MSGSESTSQAPPSTAGDPVALPGTDYLRDADPSLRSVIDAVGPLTHRPPTSVYDELVRAVIHQQLATAAAATIERRVRALFGGQVPQPAELVAAEETELRAAGLSRQKVSYLRDLAVRTADGLIGEHLHGMPDAEVIAAVTAVRGLGRWTADMLLVFCLRRPDVLPVGDLGIRKGMQRLYGLAALPAPAEMERIATPWRPYRSTATRYLWRSLELPAG